ncbi:zinc-finger domain-containing protein [Profundibacterium mesophilum]|uniref:zinc-finger domain-containing protein n=1 Tax=Profundibacterium mesophilum TaxID=1258573 RepID=UPI001F410D89|nr:zinc-finger domain-containing protein [Profundibacterium mesophilum]
MPGAPETETVSQTRVACDGGEGALGHPRVWLQIPEARGWVECGYCDKRFVLEGAPDPAHGAHFDKSVGHSDEA